MAKPTVHRFSYPWYLRGLSFGLAPLGKTRSVGSLDPWDIARTAFKAATGEKLPEDREERDRWLGPEFESQMKMLAAGGFPHLGRIHWRAVLAGAAKGRIELERYIAAGRAVGQLEEPVFVVGLPRTGTSLVQRLIAEDPKRRGLRTYELISPLPPEKPGRYDLQKRLAMGRLTSLLYRLVTPELIKIHHTTPTSLEECWILFMQSYTVLNADYLLPTTEFGDSVLASDMRPSYERYKTTLGALSLEASDQELVLKSPEHLWFLEELLAVFPNARIIWTHRDPVKAVPSYSAQISLLARQHNGKIDPHKIAERVMLRFGQGVKRATAFCDAHPDARIAHVIYDELTEDPVAAVGKALQELEAPVSDEHRTQMQAFLARPQKDKGRNRYNLEDYALTEEGIRTSFAEYTERFGIAPEKKRS